jgi:hypothetical protein
VVQIRGMRSVQAAPGIDGRVGFGTARQEHGNDGEGGSESKPVYDTLQQVVDAPGIRDLGF